MAPVDTASSRPLPASAQLERTVQRGDIVRKGDDGDAVREAQKLLKAHGFDAGAADGDMGKNTDKAVRAFQTSRGIQVDGLIGKETLRELKTPSTGVDRRSGTDRGVAARPSDRIPGQTGEELRRRAEIDAGRRRSETRSEIGPRSEVNASGDVKLAPKSMSEREKFDHYSAIVRKNGGEVNSGGKPTVLGIRGMDIDGNKHATMSKRAYDDTYVVLTADKRVLEIKGATHAGQNTSSLSRDANGTRGVGMIEPGNFTARPNGRHNGAASFHVSNNGSGSITGVRDTNGDGQFSAAERAASDRRNDKLTGVLFHQGFANSPKSIGCLTLSPTDWQKVLGRVGGSGFNFSLVQA